MIDFINTLNPVMVVAVMFGMMLLLVSDAKYLAHTFKLIFRTKREPDPGPHFPAEPAHGQAYYDGTDRFVFNADIGSGGAWCPKEIRAEDEISPTFSAVITYADSESLAFCYEHMYILCSEHGLVKETDEEYEEILEMRRFSQELVS